MLLPLTAHRGIPPRAVWARQSWRPGGAAVIEYLTENICARAAELSEALGFPLRETDALLAALREKGIITERPDDSGAFVLNRKSADFTCKEVGLMEQLSVLETERLLLRTFRPTDAEALYLLLKEEEVTRFLPCFR